MDAQWDQLAVTHHHGTDECAIGQNKRPGFVSDRLKRTSHSKIRGMKDRRDEGANWT